MTVERRPRQRGASRAHTFFSGRRPCRRTTGLAGVRPTVGSRGQGLVEFAFIVPLFLLLLLGMLEFGIAFNRQLTLEYATREGARTGAALVNGGGTLGCSSGQSPNAASVDPAIIASVERVLKEPSINVPLLQPIELPEVQWIRIYEVTSTGTVTGRSNQWTYSPGAGPLVDGVRLDFVQGAVGWTVCSRSNANPPGSLGVSISYRYQYTTPLGGLQRFIAGWWGGTAPAQSWLAMTDKTVMQLNPTQ
jgi:hypothetical protein